MSIDIKKTDDGFEISGKLDKNVEIRIPDGYRSLHEDEDIEIGDLTFNVLSNQWSPVTETQLSMTGFAASKKSYFRVLPVRREGVARDSEENYGHEKQNYKMAGSNTMGG